MPPRGIKAMLQKKLEEREKDLAEQKKSGSLGASGSTKAPPPSLSQKRPPPATIPAQDASASKRLKSLATKTGTSGSVSRVEAGEKASEGEKKKGKGTASDAVWVPNFITPDKKHVLKSDSLREDPSLAFTLHARLMLPKDIAAPQSLKAALNEYYFHVGRATQSIMSAQCYLTEHDKQSKLLRQKVEVSQGTVEEYKKSLEQSEEVRRSFEVNIANLSDLVKGLQDGTEQTRAEGKDEGLAEGGALGRKEIDDEMKKLLQEEFDKGYAQAEEDVVDQLIALQAEMKEAQHKKSFMLCFNAGLNEAGVEPEDERRSLKDAPPLPADEAEAEEPQLDEPTTNPTEQPRTETTPAEPVSTSATLSPEA